MPNEVRLLRLSIIFCETLLYQNLIFVLNVLSDIVCRTSVAISCSSNFQASLLFWLLGSYIQKTRSGRVRIGSFIFCRIGILWHLSNWPIFTSLVILVLVDTLVDLDCRPLAKSGSNMIESPLPYTTHCTVLTSQCTPVGTSGNIWAATTPPVSFCLQAPKYFLTWWCDRCVCVHIYAISGFRSVNLCQHATLIQETLAGDWSEGTTAVDQQTLHAHPGPCGRRVWWAESADGDGGEWMGWLPLCYCCS